MPGYFLSSQRKNPLRDDRDDHDGDKVQNRAQKDDPRADVRLTADREDEGEDDDAEDIVDYSRGDDAGADLGVEFAGLSERRDCDADRGGGQDDAVEQALHRDRHRETREAAVQSTATTKPSPIGQINSGRLVMT